ncbi:MAG: hypothetical protein AAFX04_13670 [Pseudomonadota bacterium]
MEDESGCFEVLMPAILGIIYGYGWWSAAAGNDGAMAWVAILSCLVAFPFFLMQSLGAMIGGKIIALILILIGLFIPLVNILLAVLIIVTIVTKFDTLFKSLPFILAGVILYSLLWAVPSYFTTSVPVLGTILPVLMGLAGCAIFYAYARLCLENGHRASTASALALGSASFLLLFVVFLLLPGDQGDLFDE